MDTEDLNSSNQYVEGQNMWVPVTDISGNKVCEGNIMNDISSITGTDFAYEFPKYKYSDTLDINSELELSIYNPYDNPIYIYSTSPHAPIIIVRDKCCYSNFATGVDSGIDLSDYLGSDFFELPAGQIMKFSYCGRDTFCCVTNYKILLNKIIE
jgi:hypothetical protein